MLGIGIIGGLSTIEMMFSGNAAIWIILVVCFCGIGVICLSASKGQQVNTEFSDVENAEISGIHIQSSANKYTDLKHHSKEIYNSIRAQVVKIDHLYLKVILTIIAIMLIIIAVELNQHLSDLTHVLWKIYQTV